MARALFLQPSSASLQSDFLQARARLLYQTFLKHVPACFNFSYPNMDSLDSVCA